MDSKRLNNAADYMVEANTDLVSAKSELEAFERNTRKHGYPVLIAASNTQKMNLEFEHLVAQHEDNWQRWQKLKNDINNAEVKLFEAQTNWECLRRIMVLENGPIG